MSLYWSVLFAPVPAVGVTSTIAYVSSLESIRTLTTDPYTFDFTPVGIPQAIVLTVASNGSSTQHGSACTYGGVALTKVNGVGQADASHPGSTEVWLLGSSVPTGMQTLSYDLSSATDDDQQFVIYELSAAGNVEAVDSEVASSVDSFDPTLTMQYAGRRAISIGCVQYGKPDVTDLVDNANMSEAATHDFASQIAHSNYQTTPGTSDFTFNFTRPFGDEAGCMTVAAFSEVGS